MVLGEKIREARKQCGLSQEQLAEKMSVSRSAVAKWESGIGLPDVNNLKALAKLLDVSIDFLLDENESLNDAIVRESYNLADCGGGSKKRKKDRVIFERFPDAKIHTLIGKQRLSRGEKIIDNVIGFFTDAPFGIPEFINGIRNLDKEFYLIEREGKQFFVVVTDEFIETRRLERPYEGSKFSIGDWEFTKCAFDAKD